MDESWKKIVDFGLAGMGFEQKGGSKNSFLNRRKQREQRRTKNALKI
jgi:hypothetical protein